MSVTPHTGSSGAGEHDAVTVDHDVFPMSFTQRRLWFLSQLEPESASYNTAIAVRLRGILDRAALEKCFNAIAERHEVLRTTFAYEAGEPVQIIAPDIRINLRVVPIAGTKEAVEDAASEEARRPFDLQQGPLMRACLFAIRSDDHVLVLTLHHIVCDGWSAQILARELSALYPAMRAGSASPLPPLPIQYADYAAWQRRWMQGDVRERQLSYWKNQLEGELPVIELPADRPRGGIQTSAGSRHTFIVPAPIAMRLRELGRQENATLFTVLLAAFQTLLSRYTGIEDICVGTPVACRTRRETEDLIGFFANTLVLRTSLAGNPPFSVLLGRVRDVVVGGQSHQDLPFEELVEVLKPARALSHSPLFQVMFVLQTALSDAIRIPGVEAEITEVDQAAAKFELSLDMTETAQGLEGTFEYNTDLFDESTIIRMGNHFLRLLEGIGVSPGTRLTELSLLTEPERRETVLIGPVVPPAHATFADLFEQQVEHTPENVAVECDGRTISYRAINREANGVARALMDHQVGGDSVVAVLTDRDLPLLTMMLGVLKAGAAYLPLDPSHPPARWNEYLESNGAVVVLTDEKYRARFMDATPDLLRVDVQVLTIEQVAVQSTQPVQWDNPRRRSSPDQLAYVIYTSGSTGIPKGAMVTQLALMNHLLSKLEMLKLTDSDVIAQTASACFDISVWQCLAALLCGGRTLIVKDDVARDPSALLACLDTSGVTVAETVPVLLQEMLAAAQQSAEVRLLALRWMLPTGEAVAASVCRAWIERYPDVPLLNAYGPAECADDVAMAEITSVPTAGAAVPIGRPVRNVRLVVVDKWLTPVPAGVPGELCIAGVAVGRGYLRDPFRTAASFVPDPFSGQPGARLYRTGDLVRLRADGNLEFIGRLDHQVKLRGVRIELGEIDARLREIPGVDDAVTVLRDEPSGRKRLTAYVVASSAQKKADDAWRTALRLHLPEAMIPSCFVPLDALPRSPNGKVDRAALPAPAKEEPRVYMAPRTAGEEALARIWAEVLDLDRVGIDDNFFELGGDSILSLQVVNLAKQAGLSMTPRCLFQAQTVAELAHRLAEIQPQRGASAFTIGEVPEDQPSVDEEALGMVRAAYPEFETTYPLSHLQQGLLFHSLYAPGSGVYIEQFSCRLCGTLNAAEFRNAWRRTIARHAVLRTGFLWREGTTPVQVVAPAAELPWTELDWAHEPADEVGRRFQQLLEEDRRIDFDFACPPLMRITLVRTAPDMHDVLWTHHHILMDGWCLPIILREVLQCYEAAKLGAEPSLAPAIPYRRYIAWLARQNRSVAETFWRRTLKGFTAPTALGGKTVTEQSSGEGACGTVSVTISAETTASIRACAQRHRVTVNTIIQGAWALLLSRYSGDEDVLFGTTVSGRSADIPDIETAVGLFINTLPLRVRVPPALTLSAWLRELLTRNSELREFEHTPLAHIQAWSDVPRGQSLFDSLIVFDNHPMDETLEQGISDLYVERVKLHGQTNYPLTVNVMPGAELMLSFWYQKSRFEHDGAVRMARHVHMLLRGMTEVEDAPLAAVAVLGREERAAVVAGWNATGRRYAERGAVPEQIAAQAARTPEAVAVRLDAATLTYAELLAQANQVAWALRERGVGPEMLVGIAMERSLDLVVGLLGVLQAGAAYVPLDPSYPPERLAYMLEDSAVPVVLTQAAWQAQLPYTGLLLCLDRDRAQWAGYPTSAPPGVWADQQLAYLIYTSGSTGQPKGAGNTHGGFRNRLQWMQEAYGLTAADRVLQKTPISFDVSVWEFFWPLMVGAELVLAAPGEHKEPARLIDRIVTHQITTLHFVPPMLQALVETAGVERCTSVRQIVCSGETLPAAVVARAQAVLPGATVHNLYGPTEAAIDVTAWRCPVPAPAVIPIGRPIANTQIYVLDRHIHPVPVGVAGELYIGGEQVGRGYHGRPGLTAERFVPDALGAQPGQRLYRTGDQVRWRVDGTLEYLGRLDHQVKLRGFRIELGEIEAALLAQPGIREAVVVVRTEATGTKRLVGYVTGAGAGETATLRQGLAQRVPEYMVPAVIIALEQLPLSPNGKVDRKALPAPEAGRATASEPPATQTEARLAAIWAQVLGLVQVGRHDNFFELGGDSINSLQILARAHRDGIQLTPKQLFEQPTIASAAAVAVLAAPTAMPVSDRPPSGIADVELSDDEMENLLNEIG
ncbi:hypothetical protein W02_10500 [Nitrospira sp. KM1]|uniref:non-ribosomal peptide synthetase n=1 Tax=Nitrospira sp. KM1 TaxID=1936990 RepID=UPI0013A7A6DA|nr:non-ribosomal peptide synthetase [Nitrospira sp. KM1]BCA53910.1 hypothetical protein W02_10500 [Nitrospira sp. KM1]